MKKRKSEFTYLLKVCRQTWTRTNMERRLCLQAAYFAPDLAMGQHLPKWLCACCKDFYAKSDVQVDHIIAVAKSAPKSLEECIQCILKLYCGLENLQVLCITCHKKKTKAEMAVRKQLECLEGIMDFMQTECASGPVCTHSGTIPDTKLLKRLEALIKRIRKSDDKMKEKLTAKFCKLTRGYF